MNGNFSELKSVTPLANLTNPALLIACMVLKSIWLRPRHGLVLEVARIATKIYSRLFPTSRHISTLFKNPVFFMWITGFRLRISGVWRLNVPPQPFRSLGKRSSRQSPVAVTHPHTRLLLSLPTPCRVMEFWVEIVCSGEWTRTLFVLYFDVCSCVAVAYDLTNCKTDNAYIYIDIYIYRYMICRQ